VDVAAAISHCACDLIAAAAAAAEVAGSACAAALSELALAQIKSSAGKKRQQQQEDGESDGALLRHAVLARAALTAAADQKQGPAAVKLATKCASALQVLAALNGQPESDDGWRVRSLAAAHLFGGLAAHMQGQASASGNGNSNAAAAAAAATAGRGSSLSDATLAQLLNSAARLLAQLPTTPAASASAAALALLAFIEQAALALTRSNAAAGDAFGAALDVCIGLLQSVGAQPSTLPRLPPAHWTLADIGAVADAAPGRGSEAAVAAMGAGVEQGLLIVLRSVVSAARRSHLLQLHRMLEQQLITAAAGGSSRQLCGALQVGGQSADCRVQRG